MLESELDFHDHSVMIFVNTALTAEKLAVALRQLRIECVEYHTNMMQVRKAENLAAFQRGSQRILVCTDSAARGFDLRRVRHVIQAEFAKNVVEHQHRVGRASRAGRIGYATNFYGPLRKELVQSILGELRDLSGLGDSDVKSEDTTSMSNDGEHSEQKTSIERSFSRRRGFRNKLKNVFRKEANSYYARLFTS